MVPLSKWEIESVVFQMDGEKAPGLDGFPPAFFHHYWPLVKKDLYCMVSSFFNRGYLLKELNNTKLILIPKKDCPEHPGDFRPISLCYVTYRIISKVLANRLKNIVPTIVTEFQNAFIKRRSISDNIILAGEVLHHLQKQKKSKNFWCGYKVDFAKAFDKLSWNFLLNVLKRINFPHIG